MKYHVKPSGSDSYTTMTLKELRSMVREETARARRYFGTAVAHKIEHDDGDISYDITARRDRRSARWVHIVARKH